MTTTVTNMVVSPDEGWVANGVITAVVTVQG